ncbi:MAG: hypothetical protein QM278_03015 [Pseudomonadota bacterium]|nr:hypothetical protein [Pseudomonadota bacterium]
MTVVDSIYDFRYFTYAGAPAYPADIFSGKVPSRKCKASPVIEFPPSLRDAREQWAKSLLI